MSGGLRNTKNFRDANHVEISDAYEELMCLVCDTSKLGGGFGDLVVRIPTRVGKILQIVEIKTEEGVLSPAQNRFICDWGLACVQIVRSREEVIAHVKRIQEQWK